MPKHSASARGSYAKGIVKREEILTRALEVIAREGYRGASVKEIAAAAELSQAGLLHYFGSKEELFTAILRKRDEVDTGQAGVDGRSRDIPLDELRGEVVRIIRHNSEVPGLVELFSRLAVDAADTAHPAHAFFVERGTALRDVFTRSLTAGQADGSVRDDINPATMARALQAIADGAQLQWMLQPEVDMTTVVDALFVLLSPPSTR
ncbi:TetR/AcrR family transcriptional regulator [Microbacterium terrisoli]|uniref:TetR/AcrR family transcriptional regulator n=1 Tax=Microbacterium terrisoli TaxID=3242192 RepID=UPI00280509E8|nr:helix-turn-helix domain-containing protein [Microbacterium protaetiae]